MCTCITEKASDHVAHLGTHRARADGESMTILPAFGVCANRACDCAWRRHLEIVLAEVLPESVDIHRVINHLGAVFDNLPDLCPVRSGAGRDTGPHLGAWNGRLRGCFRDTVCGGSGLRSSLTSSRLARRDLGGLGFLLLGGLVGSFGVATPAGSFVVARPATRRGTTRRGSRWLLKLERVCRDEVRNGIGIRWRRFLSEEGPRIFQLLFGDCCMRVNGVSTPLFDFDRPAM